MVLDLETNRQSVARRTAGADGIRESTTQIDNLIQSFSAGTLVPSLEKLEDLVRAALVPVDTEGLAISCAKASRSIESRPLELYSSVANRLDTRDRIGAVAVLRVEADYDGPSGDAFDRDRLAAELAADEYRNRECLDLARIDRLLLSFTDE